MKHIPVLLHTILDLLAPKQGGTVLDVTVGLGGHASAFLERIGKNGRLIGVDADEGNLEEIRKVLKVENVRNVELIHADFRDLPKLFPLRQAQGDVMFDVIFADLGLSSPHLDDPSRGFSFRSEGPLDCRFDRTKGKTAAEHLCDEREGVLEQIFREYGELRGAKKLASHIVQMRTLQPIRTTRDLVNIVEEVYSWRAKSLLPQVFQALRIAVNDELGALKKLLETGPTLLKPDGRMGVISYHSLEDRMVKQRFRELTTSSKHPVTGASLSAPLFQLLTKKAVEPTLEEITRNSRARSARFRAIRASTPPPPSPRLRRAGSMT